MDRNRVVVGGVDKTVGLGDLIQGRGHGPWLARTVYPRIRFYRQPLLQAPAIY